MRGVSEGTEALISKKRNEQQDGCYIIYVQQIGHQSGLRTEI
jgi:hypothetical protein